MKKKSSGMKQNSKYDIFISYRRDGGEYTAKVIRDRLNEMGYNVFFDVESLRSGDFNTKLYSVIDDCKDFLVILSPNSLDRCNNPDDWVRKEIERALSAGKNIIPIFLRGFDFPKEMPLSIEPLRFQNGVNANTEFFEAFLEKLLTFFDTKPPRRKRSWKWLKKIIAVWVILNIVSGCIFTVVALFDSEDDPYPQTAAEKNLTSELIYYVDVCLTQYDIMAGAVDDSLNSIRRYLGSGATDSTSMQNQLELSLNTLSDLDSEKLNVPETLLTKLVDSPFSVSEVRAMRDVIIGFQSEWQEYLMYLQWVVDGGTYLPGDDKLKIIECYQTILDEDAKCSAYCTNEMLLPITNTDALHDFLYTQMPLLTHIPLNASNWSDDKNALSSAQDESQNKIEDAMSKMYILVGDKNVLLNKIKGESFQSDQGITGSDADNSDFLQNLLCRICTLSGISASEAQGVAKQMIENPFDMDSFWYSSDSRASELAPSYNDSVDTLWDKLRHCTDSVDPVGGCICTMAIIYKTISDDISDVTSYTLPMLCFYERMAETGKNKGLIVKSYYEPDGVNPVIQVGDIIIAFNGVPYTNYEDYTKRKDSLNPRAPYTLTVLRLNEDAHLEEIQLELAADMPRVVVDTLNQK